MPDSIYCSAETTDSYLHRLGGLGIRVPITEGDLVFYTHDQKPIWIERKKIRDLATCVCFSHRLNTQLRRGQEAAVEYQWMYLLVEGLWRPAEDGLIEEARRGGWELLDLTGNGSYVEYARIDNYLNTLGVVEGITVKRANTEHESAKVVLDLYHWWQKPIEQHTSTRQVQKPVVFGGGQISLLRRWASELPGIGLELSGRVEEEFGCIHNLVMADVKDWQEIEGIGKVKAQKIVEAIHWNG